MSSLSDLQQLFALSVSQLIRFAEANGYGVTFGEAWRSTATARLDAEQGIGIANSLHIQRLAIDLNLFKQGEYTSDIADYKVLGDYWKTLHPDARWGGDFSHPDPDHYSFTYNGVE